MNLHDDLIYDIGVYNGDDTAYYLHKGYRVLGVEADPTLIPQIEQRFKTEIAQGRLTLFNAALAPERKTAQFWICEGYSLWNSFDREVAARMGRKHYAIDIDCWPMPDLFAKFGVPHYLKMSLHGHEHFCLQDIEPSSAPTYLSLEMLPELATSRGIFERLTNLGYEGFKLINQSTQKQLEIRPPTLKSRLRGAIQTVPGLYGLYEQLSDWIRRPGRTAAAQNAVHESTRPAGAWNFPEGSSGPFAEETEGSWKSVEPARADWETLLTRATEQGKPKLSNWYDLHARLRR